MRYGCTDVVTVINKTENGWIKNVVEGVFWYRPQTIGMDGHGIIENDSPVCVFPYETLRNYANVPSEGKFTFKRMDYVILGAVDGEISSVKDVNKYPEVITIKSIDKNMKGSYYVRHITVS